MIDSDDFRQDQNRRRIVGNSWRSGRECDGVEWRGCYVYVMNLVS